MGLVRYLLAGLEDLADLLDVTSDRSDTRAETPPTDTGAESADTRPESDTLPEDVRDYLEREDVSPKTEHGRSAVVDVFRYLREHGTAKTGEIQDAVYPEYAEEWGTARTMWNALDRYLKNGDVPVCREGRLRGVGIHRRRRRSGAPGGWGMTDATSRLGEARKQIQIAGEKLDDERLVEELEDAEAIIEAVEGDLGERSGGA